MTGELVKIKEIEGKVLNGTGINVWEANNIARQVDNDYTKLNYLLETTRKVTEKFIGTKIKKCTDGFTGTACPNTCSFCYMSTYKGEGNITNYQYAKEKGLLPRALRSPEEFLEDALIKEKEGATHYKIVGPEYMLPKKNFQMALSAYRLIKEKTELKLCASMGSLDRAHLEQLKDVGVDFYNHNLERTNWSSLNSAFDLEGRIQTNRRARQAGLKRCTGLIAGIGEDLNERINTIFLLQDLEVESLPFNLFVPPRPEMKTDQLPMVEILLSLALCRLALPQSEITLNNGNKNFVDFWDDAFKAGASGYGLKGTEDRPCFLPQGRINDISSR